MRLISRKQEEILNSINLLNIRTPQLPDVSSFESVDNKNKAGGYAGLNSSNQLDLSLFPSNLLGNVKFKGTYDGINNKINSADNVLNNKALPASTDSIQGAYFIVSTAFTLNNINYSVGDYIISNGNNGWNKISTSSSITSVHGRTGNITADIKDYENFYVKLSESYDNPSFINNLDWSKITNVPSTSSLATTTYKIVSTYQEMKSYNTPGVLTIFKVSNDEDKEETNTIYYWYPDGIRLWIPSLQDN